MGVVRAIDARGLQQAALGLMAMGRYRNSLYGAGFVLIGDGY